MMSGCATLRSEPTGTSVDIKWKSAGDDGIYGLATCLEIAITSDSTLPFDEWPRLYCDDLPPPIEPGLTQSYTITGLESDTEYYIRLRTADEMPNWSGWSNLCVKHTRDIIPPITVTDLR